MSEQITGNCSTHPYPDYWFPEFDNGRPTAAKINVLVETIAIAKELCSTCPVIDRCLEFGMEPEDLPFGIFGGKLAGERIESLGKTLDDVGRQTDEGRALVFYERIKPHLKE